jgi:NitT/TauT family transport system ATP-binding protein
VSDKTFIKVDGVGKQFTQSKTPVLALQDINLSIEKGEFICFMGPSGCGKTTLLNMLAGYDKPTSGEIRIEGNIVTEPSIKRMTVFQGYDLLPWRTARKNIELGLESLKLSKTERSEIVDKYIDMVGMSDFANQFPYEMSGGMRQRISIARALAVDPEVIFMDEPFSALDLTTRASLQKNIQALWREGNKTIVFVSHIVDEAIFLANRIVIFTPYPGKIQRIIEVPPEAKKGDSTPEYKKIRDEIYDTCKIVPY